MTCVNFLNCIFWIFIYVLIGCLVNAIIIVWEAKEKGEVVIDGWRPKEIYQIFLWPVALIECIIKSWKNLNETSKEN